jgi:hypothetical protein
VRWWYMRTHHHTYELSWTNKVDIVIALGTVAALS